MRLLFIDKYTTKDIQKMSLWALRSFGPSPAQIHMGLRDRAMLLLSTNIAFRGDSTRQVLWSDLFCKLQPMPTISEDAELDVSKQILKTPCRDLNELFRHSLLSPIKQKQIQLAASTNTHYFDIVMSNFAATVD